MGTIDRNMDFQFQEEPVVDGAAVVFNAFKAVYGDLKINCEDIGIAIVDGISINPCTDTGLVKRKGSGAKNVALSIFFAALLIMGAVLLPFIRWRRLRLQLKLEEEAPIFHPSDGVLNSDPELLNGGHNHEVVVGGDEASCQRIQKQPE